jgi:hypothetical protein
MATVTAYGASRARYDLFQNLISDDWNDVPVIYMFAYWTGTYWHVLYIGECESAKTRLPSHERWAEAKRKGATHVLNVRASAVEADRKRAERDLIASHKPEMNTHHVGSTVLTAGRRA